MPSQQVSRRSRNFHPECMRRLAVTQLGSRDLQTWSWRDETLKNLARCPCLSSAPSKVSPHCTIRTTFITTLNPVHDASNPYDMQVPARFLTSWEIILMNQGAARQRSKCARFRVTKNLTPPGKDQFPCKLLLQVVFAMKDRCAVIRSSILHCRPENAHACPTCHRSADPAQRSMLIQESDKSTDSRRTEGSVAQIAKAGLNNTSDFEQTPTSLDNPHTKP